MTKKTIGFNWGCAAVGNSVWTGVRVCDVLAHFGITKPSKEHRYVHFEGPQGELPQALGILPLALFQSARVAFLGCHSQ